MTYLSRKPPNVQPESACAGFECAVAGALDHVLLLVWLGIAGLVIAALIYIPRARAHCKNERKRTRSERDAFDAFARRIAAVNVTAAQPQEAAVVSTSMVQLPPDDALRRVRSAYEETVMAVPHYDEEYGEALTSHMGTEFDPEVAMAVGHGDQLTPRVKQALIQHSTNARDQRESLLDAIEAEESSLAHADETLGAVDDALDELNARPLAERSFDELVDAWHELRDLNERCDTLVQTRQTELQIDKRLHCNMPNAWTFLTYLYEPLAVAQPVLADATQLIEDLQTAERRVVRALTRRV